MSLSEIDLDYQSIPTPAEVVRFLRAVDLRVEQNRVNTSTQFRGFVPSDYQALYQCLKVIYDSNLLSGDRFCEWGSGVSVVASLAAMIGFESYAIEYDERLCSVADGIAEDFGLPVTLVNGSFVPPGVEDLIDEAFASQDGELSLHPESDFAYEELGYDIADFDIIFAYPWPTDRELTHAIYDRCAAQGGLLLVYYDEHTIVLYRKD